MFYGKIWVLLLVAGALLGVGGVAYLKFSSDKIPLNNNQPSVNDTNTGGSLALLKTNLGDIEIELFPDKAPRTVENFRTLSSQGFYDGTRFHRVIKGFMIQGGDPLSKNLAESARWGMGGPGYAFPDEINDQKLVKGVLAMANSGPNTNGSQFFIVTAVSTPWLDGRHTAFGVVTRGMEVVEKIENVATGQADRPLEEVRLESVTVR